MADLLSLAQMKSFLGPTAAGDDALLATLIAQVTATFERDAARSDRPFMDAQAGRIEVLDGTGSAYLRTMYPIASIVSIVLGRDAAVPDETLSPTDKNVVVWGVGDRVITRVDGGCWRRLDEARVIQLTYATQADLPTNAAIAVQRLVATVYRQRGSEDATRDQVGAYEVQIAAAKTADPLWMDAAEKLHEAMV